MLDSESMILESLDDLNNYWLNQSIRLNILDLRVRISHLFKLISWFYSDDSSKISNLVNCSSSFFWDITLKQTEKIYPLFELLKLK